MSQEPEQKNDFQKAGLEKNPSLVKELFLFVKEDKKWWMIPIVLSLGLLGLIVALGSTGAAPFIYTLF